jgi:hypothetical protein
MIFTSGHVFFRTCSRTVCVLPEDVPLRAKNVEFNIVNEELLTYISALVEFLCKIVTSVHGYEKDKVLTFNYT